MLTVIFIFIAYSLLKDVIFDFFNSNESRYIQSIGKFNALYDVITGKTKDVQEGDSMRIFYYMFILNNPLDLIIPAGLGYKTQMFDVHTVTGKHIFGGGTIDSSILYMAVHCSIISLFLFFSTIIICFTKTLILVKGISVKISLVLFMSTFLIFLTLSATPFTDVQSAFFSAMLLGCLCNYKIFNKEKRRSI
jgi:hypothetical protein